MATSRTIPAHAGESFYFHNRICKTWDYPRSRGGTVCMPSYTHLPSGLSPLTRGNPFCRSVNLAFQGTIPAPAGEPASAAVSAGLLGDYPRSRGGTCSVFDLIFHLTGLSPLTRGNLKMPLKGCEGIGTIPAHAGEPQNAIPNQCLSGDYPRSRGGTIISATFLTIVWGLSPLTRGNLGSARG